MDFQNPSPQPRHGRTLKIGAGILVLVTASMFTLVFWDYREPSFHGKRAHYWLDHYFGELGEKDPGTEAFKAMGSNAVPFLIKVLEGKPSGLAKMLDEKLYDTNCLSLSLPGWLTDHLPSARDVEDRRETAASIIGEIGPDAQAAIPALIRIFEELDEVKQSPPEAYIAQRLQSEVFTALESMGEKGEVVIPKYLDYLASDDEDWRIAGADLLGSIGPKAKVAVPLLRRATEGTSKALCWSAGKALWNIDRQSDVAVRVYTEGLGSTNSGTRERALIYLRQMGPAASAAGLAVQAVLYDPDYRLRREAEKTLQETDPNLLQRSPIEINEHAGANVERLIHVIRTGDRLEKWQALETIAVFGSKAKPAVSALIEVLGERAAQPPSQFDSPYYLMRSRRGAAKALAEIGPEARDAVPALIAAFSEHRGWQDAYCKALGRIGAAAEEAATLLEDALGNENPRVRLAAADALTRILPQQSSNAIATLKSFQKEAIGVSICGVDQCGATLLASANSIQDAGDRFCQLAASASLWRLGLQEESPVAQIAEELGKRDSSYAEAYVELLGEIGSEAKPVLSLLKPLLNPDCNDDMRRAVAIAIRKIDSELADELRLPGLLALP